MNEAVRARSRWVTALTLTAVMTGGACSRSTPAPPPPVDDTVAQGARPSAPAAREQSSGLSGRQKVVLLAGAAALYYLYKKHQNAAAPTGEEGQYFLSKNGRVYYRDAEHRAHWVTPPPAGIAVPADEAAGYRDFQGYDNRPTGRDLSGLAAGGTP